MKTCWSGYHNPAYACILICTVYYDLGSCQFACLSFFLSLCRLVELLSAQPTNVEAALLLGVTYSRRKSLRKAEEIFQRILKANPSHSNALYQLGTYVGVILSALNFTSLIMIPT